MITREKVIQAIEKVSDPEIGLNVWFLGLIYDISVEQNNVKIVMTFTTPFCPYGPSLVEEIKGKVLETGASAVDVEIVMEPPWQPSEEVKLALGIF
jgi:metal-sulfur cluster biosynthetic enzyme